VPRPCLGISVRRSERLSLYRATERVFRIVADGFPDAAATPRSGLADPIHHPRETIQPTRQRQRGSRMARPPAPSDAFCNALRSTDRDTCDQRLPQTPSTTCTHVPLGYLARRTPRFLASFAHAVHGAFSRRSTRFGDSTRHSSSAFSSASETIFDSADDSNIAFVRP